MNITDEVIAQIYQTADYDKFKRIKGNREITPAHINKLIKSIGKVGYILQPTLVNENYEVVDGQTRLAACKELNIPVSYMVAEGYGTEEVKAVNLGQTNWSTLDFVKEFAENGNANYQTVLDFMNKHNFTLSLSTALLRDSVGTSLPGSLTSIIKSGLFKAGNQVKAAEKAHMFNQLLAFLPAVRERRAFQEAILTIFNVQGYDHERMLEVIERRPQTILDSLDSKRTCTIALQKLYNARLSASNRVRFWNDL